MVLPALGGEISNVTWLVNTIQIRQDESIMNVSKILTDHPPIEGPFVTKMFSQSFQKKQQKTPCCRCSFNLFPRRPSNLEWSVGVAPPCAMRKKLADDGHPGKWMKWYGFLIKRTTRICIYIWYMYILCIGMQIGIYNLYTTHLHSTKRNWWFTTMVIITRRKPSLMDFFLGDSGHSKGHKWSHFVLLGPGAIPMLAVLGSSLILHNQGFRTFFKWIWFWSYLEEWFKTYILSEVNNQCLSYMYLMFGSLKGAVS